MIIAEVVHVGIKASTAHDKGADADHDNQKNGNYQWLFTVKWIIDNGRSKR